MEMCVVRKFREETGHDLEQMQFKYLFTNSFYEDFSKKTVYALYSKKGTIRGGLLFKEGLRLGYSPLL